MEIIASLFAAAVVCFILFRINKTGKTDDNKVLSSSNIASNYNDNCNNNDSCNRDKCKELCLKTLKELNCEVQISEDDVFEFAFQGYRFAIVYGKGFIRIMLLDWHEIDLDDIDMLARARRLINEMNTDDPFPCLMYFISEDEHKMFIRAMTDTLFIREIPDIKRYLGNNLEWFFPKVFEFKNRIAQ